MNNYYAKILIVKQKLIIIIHNKLTSEKERYNNNYIKTKINMVNI